jgi:hypothetical protein
MMPVVMLELTVLMILLVQPQALLEMQMMTPMWTIVLQGLGMIATHILIVHITAGIKCVLQMIVFPARKTAIALLGIIAMMTVRVILRKQLAGHVIGL